MHFGTAWDTFRQPTGYRPNHNILRIGIIFGRIRVGQSEHVPAELDQCVLKSGARPQIRQIPPPRKLYAEQNSCRAPKRAAWSTPDSIKMREMILGIWAF
jgi:hypothetical protein